MAFGQTQPHALITGGAGFIGSHLVDRLLVEGYRVTIIDNLSTGRWENIAHHSKNPGVRFAIEDIRNEMIMDRLVSECDVLFHLAAAVGVKLIVERPIDTIETNIRGTEVVLKAAGRYRKPVLLASTSEVYGKSNKVPFREDDDGVYGATTKSRWSYAVSKALDEFLALAYYESQKLPVTIFRLFNTVGPRQVGHYGMVVPRFVKAALANEPIEVYDDGKQSRCFANVYDIVDALIKLSQCGNSYGEVFNIGSTEEVTIMELAQRVQSATHSTSEIVLVPYEKAYKKGYEDMRRRVPDTSKIERLIQWKATTALDQTIQQMIEYYRNLEKTK
ncbi:MAG: GDP-mannose 4,6-dehydratase [Anaerolineae bacterium]|nr:GDP-mannose 4,6-dehydratase [Anaerolineae bacterium]